MTFKDLINEVLLRLREDVISLEWTGDIRVAEGITDYQRLIASFVNDAKLSAESYHDWIVLRETFSVTTVPATMQYTLGDEERGAGSTFKVLDVINEQSGGNLTQANNEWLNKRAFPEAATGEPLYYAFNGTSQVLNTRDADMNVDLYPIPETVQVINFNIVLPQERLSLYSDRIKIPSQPVLLKALASAISERGEDGGTQSGSVLAEAASSLNTAVSLDAGNTEYERDWYVG